MKKTYFGKAPLSNLGKKINIRTSEGNKEGFILNEQKLIIKTRRDEEEDLVEKQIDSLKELGGFA